MARPLRFVFEFPPTNGFFDAGYWVIYIFGKVHESDIEDIIVHEALHHVLSRIAGKRASLKLDNIYTQLDN